jgi:hypothetical protein
MIFISLNTENRLTGYRQGPYEEADKTEAELFAPEGFSSGDFRTNQFCIYDPAAGAFTKDQTAIDLQEQRDNPPAPVPTPEQIQDEIVTATQQRLDDFAKTRNYDGILSACTYAADPNPKFAFEGQYCIDARGATWTKLYEIMAEVEAGTRPMPSGYADIEGDLPVLAWPTQPE